jgi:hypothetical protein
MLLLSFTSTVLTERYRITAIYKIECPLLKLSVLIALVCFPYRALSQPAIVIRDSVDQHIFTGKEIAYLEDPSAQYKAGCFQSGVRQVSIRCQT